MERVMEEAVFPAFQKKWSGEGGDPVEFAATFAGSGQVAQKIMDRFPSEVAILASQMDSVPLTTGDPADLPYDGALARTPLVIAVRAGNPHRILDFEDLAKPGIQIVHPDPLTSGAGQWSLLAVYGAAIRSGLDDGLARQRMNDLWRNVVASPPSNGAALREFRNGVGDAMITYEASLLPDPGGGTAVEIVYPRRTIICEARVVPIPVNIHPDQRKLVEAFLGYLWSREAQAMLVQYGFRPMVAEVPDRADFGTVQAPFGLDEFGGARAKMTIVEPFLRARAAAERPPQSPK